MSVSTLGDSRSPSPRSPSPTYHGRDYRKPCSNCGQNKTCSADPTRSKFYFNRHHNVFQSWCIDCMKGRTSTKAKEDRKVAKEVREGLSPTKVYLALDERIAGDAIRYLEHYKIDTEFACNHDLRPLYDALVAAKKDQEARKKEVL